MLEKKQQEKQQQQDAALPKYPGNSSQQYFIDDNVSSQLSLNAYHLLLFSFLSLSRFLALQ